MAWTPITLPAGKPTATLALARAGFSCCNIGGVDCVWGDAAMVAEAEAVLAGYDPLPDARDQARAAVDAERRRRGALVLPDDPDTRWQAGWHATLVTYKLAKGLTLSAADQAMEAQLLALAVSGSAIDAAADAMLVDIDALTDPAAVLAYDVAGSVLWP
jgi:hypothetical protein